MYATLFCCLYSHPSPSKPPPLIILVVINTESYFVFNILVQAPSINASMHATMQQAKTLVNKCGNFHQL
jgi:hypothetical protein